MDRPVTALAEQAPAPSESAGRRPSRAGRIITAIVSRVIGGVLVLWGAATLTFLALHIPKGDPAMMLLGGPEAQPTPEVLAQVNAEWGFDKPLWTQYLLYFGRLLRGDLGTSYQQRMSVVGASCRPIASTTLIRC